MNNFQFPVSDLTDERAEQITATWPKCPTCGLPPVHIAFTYHAQHNLSFELDGSPNLEDSARTLVYDREYDILDKEPQLEFMLGQNSAPHGIPLVECETGHEWREPRLKKGTRDSWELLPETVQTQIWRLEFLRKQHALEYGPIPRTYGDES